MGTQHSKFWSLRNCSSTTEKNRLSSPKGQSTANSSLSFRGIFVIPLSWWSMSGWSYSGFLLEPQLLGLAFMSITPLPCPEDCIPQHFLSSGSNILPTPSFLMSPEPCSICVYDIHVTFSDEQSKSVHSLPSDHLWIFLLISLYCMEVLLQYCYKDGYL